MAKWTVTFEDQTEPTPGVSIAFHGDGTTVVEHEDGAGWTPATCCALALSWAWEIGLFQRVVMRVMPKVVKFHEERMSRQKSTSG